MPGRAAAHGIKGGIPERTIKGEFGEARGRPLSRTAIGRAGQRAYDRTGQFVEATRGPGGKFSTSQRAARMKERELRKRTARTGAEVTRLERVVRKGIGKLGRSPAGREALIATLEAPRGLTPRQAVEVKLADVRSTIERPRTATTRDADIAFLEKRLDRLYEASQLTDIRRKRSSPEEYDAARLAHEQVLAEIGAVRRQIANATGVRYGAVLAEPDLGKTGASPVAAKRLAAQVKALESALADGIVDRDDFARAARAAETLSQQADEYAKTVLGMTDEALASRRNLVASRYAEKGLLPEGVEPEARGFFPHREQFESVGGRLGGPTLAASGPVVGRPSPGRAFERRQNELRLYEQGRVQTNPRVLSNTVRQRARYATTVEARRYLYEQGQPIRAGEAVPEGFMLVRNSDTGAEQIPPSVRAAIENPERYAELADRSGSFPEAATFAQWVDSWLYRGHGPEPEWLVDLENVRAVPEGVARTLLADVFATAPRGSFMAILGGLNALVRATTIYTPYLGARYVARNTVQNLVLLAMTQPRAFLRTRQSIATLRRNEPDVYDAITAEAGTIPAAAGLPELAGRRQSGAQRVEAAATDASRAIADKLGGAADEPWRVAAWLEYARQYGFGKPAERHRLLTSDEPEIARVRDDIAQRVRDDMLDFDLLAPKEREVLSRVFFIWAFKRAALKWPFMYVREYPVRSALLSLVAAQHTREETRGRATSVLESGRTEIGGREVDLGWVMPHAPAAETIEDLAKTADGLSAGRIEARPIAGLLSPQYRSAVDALGYGGEPTEQITRAIVPGVSTVEKIGRGGGAGEQVLRGLGSTIDYIEEGGGGSTERARMRVREEARAVITGLHRNAPGILRENPGLTKRLRQAFARKQAVEVLRAEIEHEFSGRDEKDARNRAKLVAETNLLVRWGVKRSELPSQAWISKASLDDIYEARRYFSDHYFEAGYLELLREAREAAGVEG